MKTLHLKTLISAMILSSATNLQAGTSLGGLASELSGGTMTYNGNGSQTNNGTISATDEGRGWNGSHSNVAGMVNVAPSSLKTNVNMNSDLTNNGTIEAINKAWTYGGSHRNCAGMVNIGC